MGTEEIVDDIPRNMCRACLATEGIFQYIFRKNKAVDLNINLAEMIMENTSVKISMGDGLPDIICFICAEKCIELYKFKRKCETSDLHLRRLFCCMKQPEQNINIKTEKKHVYAKNSIGNRKSTKLLITEQITSYNESQFKVQSKDFAPVKLDARQTVESDDSILDSLPLQLIIKKNETKKHKCKHCNMRFFTRSNFNRHVKAFSVNNVFTCHPSKKGLTPNDFDLSECDKAKITEKMKLKHDKYKYECSICNMLFLKLSNLNRHTRVHSATRNFICVKCKKTFIKLEYLNTHMNIHDGIMPHVCQICSRGFKQICTLKDHIRTHSEEKLYLCTFCGKGFKQASSLHQHLQRHATLKPHLCSECGNGFASKGELTTHTRTHTGAKPFICPTCGRAFGRSDLLTKHKRTHTGERPYKCGVCQLAFSTNGILARHMRVHTGEKPYICKCCSRAFSQSNDLSKHMRSHEGEKLFISESSGRTRTCRGA